jgi:rhodanese-related sulfurtransferase
MFKLPDIVSSTLAAFALLFSTGAGAEEGPMLTAPEALAKAQAGQIVLIDVRTPREWRQTGVAEGAITIDMTRKTFVTEILNAVEGDKDASIALICRTGNRTTHTQKALQQMGFSRVYNVKEGMSGSDAGPGWVRRGLPVESCQTC